MHHRSMELQLCNGWREKKQSDVASHSWFIFIEILPGFFFFFNFCKRSNHTELTEMSASGKYEWMWLSVSWCSVCFEIPPIWDHDKWSKILSSGSLYDFFFFWSVENVTDADFFFLLAQKTDTNHFLTLTRYRLNVTFRACGNVK